MRKLLNLFVMMGVFGITLVSCENELTPPGREYMGTAGSCGDGRGRAYFGRTTL